MYTVVLQGVTGVNSGITRDGRGCTVVLQKVTGVHRCINKGGRGTQIYYKR